MNLLLTFDTIKAFLLFSYLLVVMIVVFLSWLYMSRTTRATKAIGLHAPEYLKLMTRVSIVNALFTAFLITVFLITKIY